MHELVFIFFIIIVVTGLIYFLYKMMLGSEGMPSDDELQITSGEMTEQINILRRQKKYNIAENLAKKYLLKKPHESAVRAALAKSLYESRNIFEAIDQAKIIIASSPDNFEMQIFLVNCFLEIEKPMKAINVLQDVLENNPNNAVAIREIAQIYYDTNQRQSALKMYERLGTFLENTQEKIKNKMTIAEIHVGFKEYSVAIEEYLGILEILPEDISVKKRLIDLYRLNLNYDSLIALATDIYEGAPQSNNGLWALNVLMETYRILMNFEKALEYANLIKEHQLSDKTLAGTDYAEVLLDNGQIDQSIEMLKALLEKNPGNTDLQKSLARSYVASKDFEGAVKLYKNILNNANAVDIQKIHFEMSNLYSNWAMYLFSEGNNEECFKYFLTALKYSEENPDIYYRLGNVNKSIKNFNESISQYKKAIELNNVNSEYYWAVAECYEEIDSVFEQKKSLSECLKYNPTNAMAYYKLALIFESQNDTSNALINIKKSIELDGSFVASKHKYALLLEHIGNIDEAIEVYEGILQLEPENEEIINNLKMLKS